MYKIIGTYNGKSEEIDSADTLQDAQYLRGEYQLAYGDDWYITFVKRAS